MMIEYRTVRDELDRFDEIHRDRLCACCAADPEAQGSSLRKAFERAGAKGKSNFMACANCGVRWLAEPDVNYAVIGWMMIISEEMLVAVLCAPCAREHPEPMKTLPRIAERVLRQSRGPLQ
jgi:hypothetical protein